MNLTTPVRRRLNRRTLLRTTGGALLLVGSGGLWRALDQEVFTPRTGLAYEPWHDWQGDDQTGPLALIPAAILAANAHNIQPWRFHVSASRIDLYADPTRSIGSIDPFARERDISLGCAVENLLLAAGVNGLAADLHLRPEGVDPMLAARVNLMPGEPTSSSLYNAIPLRHTNRYRYDSGWHFASATRAALTALGNDDDVTITWFATEAERQAMAGLLVAAAKAINADHEQSSDNIDRWLRQDADAVQRHRDGLILDAAGLSPLELVAAKMLPQQSLTSAAAAWLTSEEEQVATAAAFGLLTVRDPASASQRMKVGRLWQRTHLWLTDAGLAAQPMNQIHERVDREQQRGLEPTFGKALQRLLGDPSRQGVFTFRLGFPTRGAPASPRRAFRDVLV